MFRLRLLWGLVLVVALMLPAVAAADDDVAAAKQEIAGLWNVDAMMRQAADNIARRYNMNDYQKQRTRELMVREVTKFLDTHPDIWPVLRDMTRYQMKGEVPQGDAARRLSQMAGPLLEEARSTILGANSEWRGLLTDDQKKLHDYDLQDMERTFGKMGENFRAMNEGKPVQQGVFPEPNTPNGQPAMPAKPPQTWKPRGDASSTNQRRLPEDFWDNYVQNFIRDFELDNAQSDTAWSMLRDCKARAVAYRKSKDPEFTQVREGIAASSKGGKPSLAELQGWRTLEKNLNKPIAEIYDELKRRLDTVPRDSQKEKAAAKGVRGRRPGEQGRVPASQPTTASAPATQPATTTAPASQPATQPAVPRQPTTAPTAQPPAPPPQTAAPAPPPSSPGSPAKP